MYPPPSRSLAPSSPLSSDAFPHRTPTRRAFATLLAIVTLVACGRKADAPSGPVVPVVAKVAVSLSPSSIYIGSSTVAAATVLDRGGKPIAGKAVSWSSSDTSVARVASDGLVSAMAQGTALIIATAGGMSGTAAVTVTASPFGDFAIADAQFTQGVQASDGSIPVVLNGGAAVVNVLITGTFAGPVPMQVVLRLTAPDGALVRTDTVLLTSPVTTQASFTAPTVQFLVPASVLTPGLRWQVVRDPKRVAPDDSVGNDAFPRSGPAALQAAEVPTLRLRFVPIVLAAHNNSTGNVTAANIDLYLRTLLSIHPIGRIVTTIGQPFTTSASFGTAPAGGKTAFWTQLLAELDAARLADPTSADTHWIGVVAPPAGFTNTAYGGFSYIPTNGTSIGANTRTVTLVNVGWFNRPTQTRDLVAHELGHNFGRLHAPACGAGSPIDALFPTTDGTIGRVGHDVWSWSWGVTAGAAVEAATIGDVMGYCFPVWNSTYTYRAVLQFRGTLAATSLVADAAPRMERVLMVRGRVESGRVALDPAVAMDARASLPERAGAYMLDGLAADGRVLFSYPFEPAVLDHSTSVRPFAMSIPMSDALEATLTQLRASGPMNSATMQRTKRLPALPGVASDGALVGRGAGGTLRVACTDAAARAIMVQDAVSGAVLGSANAAELRLADGALRSLRVSCSDGVGSTRVTLALP